MLGLQFTVARSQSFFTSLEFLDIPDQCYYSLRHFAPSEQSHCLSGSAFPITLRLHLVFLDAYHMGSAITHCVALLLVSKATAST